MDMELDEIFQWQTSFCTLLADIGGIAEDGIDGMLDQIELPELQDDIIPGGGGGGGGGAVATNLSSAEPEPVSSPLWPCDLDTNSNFGVLRLPPVQLSASTKLPAASFQEPLGSPQSSSAPVVKGAAPFTPAAAKPKRARASKSTIPKAKKPCLEVAELPTVKEKENRLPTQAEHIIRERQRRDDMATKYSILESLLPPAPKRERAVVVESAMLFVKELQQKRSELLNRRAQLKLRAPSQHNVQSKKIAPLHNDSSGGFMTASGCKKPLQAENCRMDSPISSTRQETLITSPGTTNPSQAAVEDPTSSGSAIQQLHVHVHFSDNEIVIELVCHQPRHDFQSFLLQAVESFGLDVVRCSIHRVPHGFVQCTITCSKSQVLNASLDSSEIRTSATLIGALKKVLTRS